MSGNMKILSYIYHNSVRSISFTKNFSVRLQRCFISHSLIKCEWGERTDITMKVAHNAMRNALRP